MPLFQRWLPLASSASATSRFGFSMKRSTRCTPLSPASGSAGAIQPKPVSGRDGVIPNVTSQPSAAAATACASAA